MSGLRLSWVDPLRDPAWASLAAQAPGASIFHHPAWIALVAGTYRYPVAGLLVLEPSGRAVAGLPVAAVASRLTGRRLVALPFSDTCPPLVAPDAPAGALERLAEGLEAERRRRGVPLEVRAALPEAGAPADRFLGHVLDLRPGLAEVERGFRSQARRNVRNAERRGVTVRRATDAAALDAFYALHMQTRRRLGVPTQPRRFIAGLARLFDQGLGYVGLAILEGRAVAAAVFLRSGGTLTYKYGASDAAHLRARPNNALFADAIRWGCGEGLARLDFGRTDADQDGLRDFKRSWGAVEEPVAYTYAGQEPPAHGPSRAELALAEVIRRTPPRTGALIGSALYRHVG